MPVLLLKRKWPDRAGRAETTALVTILAAVVGAAEPEPGDKKTRQVARVKRRLNDAGRARSDTVATPDAYALEIGFINASGRTKPASLRQPGPRDDRGEDGCETRGKKKTPL